MTPKSLALSRSSLLRNLIILFFLISFKSQSQVVTITEIHTDWKGYWKSNALTGVGNRPDDYNNLLAFKWNNTTYSTGIDDNTLTTKGVAYNAQKFRALKIGTLGLNNNMYILQGSSIDTYPTQAFVVPALAGSSATGAELAARLTDGPNGLSLGTGVANIKAGFAEFKIGTNNLNLLRLDDGIPDLLVTQVADPGGSSLSDIFKFVDASGNTVGNEVSVAFGSVAAVGTYSLDLFKADGGTNPFTPASTRDIRLVGLETKAFGINSSNAAQVDRFVINFSGSSDCAFIAFNSNSLRFAELGLIKTATMPSCGKEGDQITYNFTIKNTGEVPITDISITDPMVGLSFTGNYIASLAPLEVQTITGKYTITAADVAAGKIVNSAKVTGKDPSLNVIEDISGDDYSNNVATTTNLLSPPTIGTVTNVSCEGLGKIVLNNLPSTGSWSITRSGSATPINGSGTSYTVDNLAVGTYNFRVKNSDGCVSPVTIDTPITDQTSTTWNGTGWSNGLPTATKNVIINSASSQPFTADASACSLTINSSTPVIIPSGVTITVTNSVTSNGQLIFQNNSSLMQGTNAVNTGNITYKRIAPKIRQADFVYWSTPVSPQTLFNVSQLTMFDKFFYNNAPGWIAINSSSVMEIGKGYIIRGPETYSNTVKADYEASFIGVPNNGDYSTPSLTVARYHLIGNPYPSALSVDRLIDGNTVLNGAVYLWTHNTSVNPVGNYNYNPNDYAAYNRLGSVGTVASTGNASNPSEKPTGFIGAGQAFFVSTKLAGPVNFTNSMREAGTNNSQFFKSSGTSKEAAVEKDRVWLNLISGEGAFKQLLVGYTEGATNGYENRYDAVTMDGNPYMDFYSMINANKFTIQGRALPFVDTDIVPLGYRTSVAGSLTIAIDEVDGKMSNQAIYIEDKLTGTVQDLRYSNYTFKSEIGTFSDRLVLKYTNKTLGTGDFENIEDGILVSVKNKVINVISSKENIKEVTVYDITGKQLYNKKKVGSTELQIQNLQSSNQVLLVKITLANDFITTRKVIFQ
jgi:hypothetical protein